MKTVVVRKEEKSKIKYKKINLKSYDDCYIGSFICKGYIDGNRAGRQ